MDLPWTGFQTTTAMDANAASSSGPVLSDPESTDFIKFPTSFVQSKVAFGLAQIEHAKAHIQLYTRQIAYFENQVADYRLLLEVGVFSEQKGGAEESKNEDSEDTEK